GHGRSGGRYRRVRLFPCGAAWRDGAVWQHVPDISDERRIDRRAAEWAGYVRGLYGAGYPDHHRQRAADRRIGAGIICGGAAVEAFRAGKADGTRRDHCVVRRGFDGLGGDECARLHRWDPVVRHFSIRIVRLGVWRCCLWWRLAWDKAASLDAAHLINQLEPRSLLTMLRRTWIVLLILTVLGTSSLSAYQEELPCVGEAECYEHPDDDSDDSSESSWE